MSDAIEKKRGPGTAVSPAAGREARGMSDEKTAAERIAALLETHAERRFVDMVKRTGADDEQAAQLVEGVHCAVHFLATVLHANRDRAPNHLTIGYVTDGDGANYELTIRKHGGITPADRIAELEAEVARREAADRDRLDERNGPIPDGTPLYYIRDTRQVVGNSALWWCPEGCGYTCDLDAAGLYTWEQCQGRRDTDVPYRREDIDAAAERHARFDFRDAPKPATEPEPAPRGDNE